MTTLRDLFIDTIQEHVTSPEHVQRLVHACFQVCYSDHVSDAEWYAEQEDLPQLEDAIYNDLYDCLLPVCTAIMEEQVGMFPQLFNVQEAGEELVSAMMSDLASYAYEDVLEQAGIQV